MRFNAPLRIGLFLSLSFGLTRAAIETGSAGKALRILRYDPDEVVSLDALLGKPVSVHDVMETDPGVSGQLNHVTAQSSTPVSGTSADFAKSVAQLGVVGGKWFQTFFRGMAATSDAYEPEQIQGQGAVGMSDGGSVLEYDPTARRSSMVRIAKDLSKRFFETGSGAASAHVSESNPPKLIRGFEADASDDLSRHGATKYADAPLNSDLMAPPANNVQYSTSSDYPSQMGFPETHSLLSKPEILDTADSSPLSAASYPEVLGASPFSASNAQIQQQPPSGKGAVWLSQLSSVARAMASQAKPTSDEEMTIGGLEATILADGGQSDVADTTHTGFKKFMVSGWGEVAAEAMYPSPEEAQEMGESRAWKYVLPDLNDPKNDPQYLGHQQCSDVWGCPRFATCTYYPTANEADCTGCMSGTEMHGWQQYGDIRAARYSCVESS